MHHTPARPPAPRNPLKLPPTEPEFHGRRHLDSFVHESTGEISILTIEEHQSRVRFVDGVIRDLRPVGTLELAIAASIAEGYLSLARYRAVEDNTFALGHYTPPGDVDLDNHMLHTGLTQARTFLEGAREIERLSQCQQRSQRMVERQRAELLRIQAERKARESQEQQAQEHQAPEQPVQPAPEEITTPSEVPAHTRPAAANGSVFSIADLRRQAERPQPARATPQPLPTAPLPSAWVEPPCLPPPVS